MMNINELNKSFSYEDESGFLIFEMGQSNIPVIKIKNKQATAAISLQGAHLISWKPTEQDDVIWLSEDATFATGKSIRGGIPICWPWFGAHENNPSFPAHGFARTVLWQVTNTKKLSDNETQITFQLSTNKLPENIQEMWRQDTVVEYRLTISNVLRLELTTLNKSKQDITISQALHTYFNISDINNTKVYGLESKEYLDKTDNFNSKIQSGLITITDEVDRVYLESTKDVTIDNNKRKIAIKKQGSHTTVVWNPWQKVANKMGDLGENGYKKMLCVESANAATDIINIKAGKSHTLLVEYSIEKNRA